MIEAAGDRFRDHASSKSSPSQGKALSLKRIFAENKPPPFSATRRFNKLVEPGNSGARFTNQPDRGHTARFLAHLK